MARARSRTQFFCKDCGHEAARWEGQCRGCGEWNTMMEAPPALKTASARKKSGGVGTGLVAGQARTVLLEAVEARDVARLSTGIRELDFVLGGGIVPGSLVLLGGEPGIGKSTILTQTAARLVAAGHGVLYASGEESAGQVKLRAQRLGPDALKIPFLPETEVGSILERARESEPAVLIVDSIQTLWTDTAEGAAGLPTQIRETATQLQAYAKATNTAVIIVGHVTKGGDLAGPKTLEHIVDVVLHFDHTGDGEHRLVRAQKNRFGSVDELGVFRMTESGLEEVPNPSAIFLADRSTDTHGSAITATLEGTRPILLEVQGLASVASYGSPQRVATGYARQRLSMLAAVLEKRAGIPCSQLDLFVNVIGGVSIEEPAADLALAVALASSATNKPVPPNSLFLGEVGLNGEIRRVTQMERRLSEAASMGITTAYIAQRAKPSTVPPGMSVVRVENLAGLIREVLGISRAGGDDSASGSHSRRESREGSQVARRNGRRMALAIPGDGDGRGDTEGDA